MDSDQQETYASSFSQENDPYEQDEDPSVNYTWKMGPVHVSWRKIGKAPTSTAEHSSRSSSSTNNSGAAPTDKRIGGEEAPTDKSIGRMVEEDDELRSDAKRTTTKIQLAKVKFLGFEGILVHGEEITVFCYVSILQEQLSSAGSLGTPPTAGFSGKYESTFTVKDEGESSQVEKIPKIAIHRCMRLEFWSGSVKNPVWKLVGLDRPLFIELPLGG